MVTEETLCRVRRRTDEDIEACVRALADVHRHDGYPLDWPARPADWLRGDSVLGAWVGELDGRPVAHVTLSTAAEDDLAPAAWSERTGAARDATAVLGRLFVAPRARSHRLGARLIAEATAEARRRALHPVLDVVASDTSAVALYERLGWHRLTTVRQQWGRGRTVTLHCYAAPA
ncbi:GNAT family N-acetyltransferase [Streptomyces sp. NPDC012637]|uniref:GNAT family N-acetyltransferase n=1 Tax=Streptomyces sp. NPDC012637 TaxID=3364842 RepID=UPI0036E9760F